MTQSPAQPATIRWIVLLGCCALYVSFGTAIGAMAPLVDEMMVSLDLSRTAMGSILGAWSLIYVATAVPLGSIVDRVGLRIALLVGGSAVAASLTLRALATGGISLFLAVAVFGLGGPLVSTGAPKLVSALFGPEERRLPTGMIVASPTLGTLVGVALVNPVLLPALDNSWRMVMAAGAAFAWLTVIVWALLPSADRYQSDGDLTNRPSIRQVLAVPALRWILAIAIPYFFFGHALTNWIVEILTDVGWSDNNAGYVAAAGSGVGIVGSLTIARFAPVARRSVVLRVIFATLAFTVLALATSNTAMIAVGLLVAGFARAGVIPLLFLVTMDHPRIGAPGMGAASGLFFAVGQIGAWLGPFTTGVVADTTDSFRPALVVLAGAMTICALLSFGLGRSQLANT